MGKSSLTRDKLRRQDAVVFPVKANGTENMASVVFFFLFFLFFYFFFLSHLDSEILGDGKAIPFQGRSQRNSYNGSSPCLLDM